MSFSLLPPMQFLRGDPFRLCRNMWSPLCALCVLRRLFHLGDFRFHGFYQLCEHFFAFLSCLGIDILGDAFTVDSRCEPPLGEVVVYHGDATRAGLANLAIIRLKFRLYGGFRRRLLTCLGRLHALREFGHLCVCAANHTVDLDCRLPLHRIGDMTINVECGLGADVSYHSGESPDIHICLS